MIKYYKLFDLLNRKGMKKTDLLKIISSPTLAKLSKGDIIKTDIIDKICQFLNCQPGDIMESIPEQTYESLMTENIIDEMYDKYDIYQDLISKEEFKELLKRYTKIKNGEGIIDQSKLTEKIKQIYNRRLEDR